MKLALEVVEEFINLSSGFTAKTLKESFVFACHVLKNLPKSHLIDEVAADLASDAVRQVVATTLALKWEESGDERPDHGQEIRNVDFATALQSTTDFTLDDLAKFGIDISTINIGSFIISNSLQGAGVVCFKPAVLRPRSIRRGVCSSMVKAKYALVRQSISHQVRFGHINAVDLEHISDPIARLAGRLHQYAEYGDAHPDDLVTLLDRVRLVEGGIASAVENFGRLDKIVCDAADKIGIASDLWNVSSASILKANDEDTMDNVLEHLKNDLTELIQGLGRGDCGESAGQRKRPWTAGQFIDMYARAKNVRRKISPGC